MGCQHSVNQHVESSDNHLELLDNSISNNLIEEKEATTGNVKPHASPHQNSSMKQTGRVIGKLSRLLNSKNQTTSDTLQDCECLHESDATSHQEDEKEESTEQVMEEAVQSILCPICLDVYECPVVLPCGHSFCIYHTSGLKGKCPICRNAFSDLDLKSESNATLSKNIRKIVELSRMIDPERETLHRAELRIQKDPKPRDISVSATKATRETLLGLFLLRRGGKLFVSKIRPTSPFDETDLQPGFEVISINGTLCETESLNACVNIVHDCVGKVTIVARRY